ncbi:MAG: HlyD family type I secretion periplasmic adaptor subunit [Gammaproteobacteria bacterium]|nr:HlyD family type I secretion periplasmic adaptor subunit [Gammaproteobacteria bacterium]
MAKRPRHKETDFLPEVDAAHLERLPRAGHLILWLTVLFLAAALAWAWWAEVDEVTRADGRVIPSSQVQVVQNLEGGIVSAILVREGDWVDRDQVLLRIDDTRFSATMREGRLRIASLEARIGRLAAEVEERPFVVPPDLDRQKGELYAGELALYHSRQQELTNSVDILRQQLTQKTQELRELQAERDKLVRGLALARKELEITAPLVDKGAMSEMDLIRRERDVNDLAGQLEMVRLAIPRVRAAIEEAEGRIRERRLRFITEARTQLNEARAELDSLEESNISAADRVRRTAVRAPLAGTVKQVMVTTLGGVIQPGMDLVEIVPAEDTLLVEARVRPADIAFLHPGQPATVKLTAYDFAIYGGLEATLEHISADSIMDEQGEHFFEIRLRTKETHLGSEEAPLPIMSGMTASVDILTGRKTILDYLMKPIRRAQERALRER